MIIIIRGHIRSSFNNNDLFNLINDIYKNNNDLEIYISTFSIFQNNVSWRKMPINNTVVTNQIIYNYFRDLSHLIKYILIIDDTTINLIGTTKGPISKLCKSPILGWKRYWYCKYKIIEYINSIYILKDTVVVNIRFDIFSNSNNLNKNEIIQRIETKKSSMFTKNYFIIDTYRNGIDNFYIGTIALQYKLAYNFFYNLDIIIQKNEVVNQERLVFIENNLLV